MSDSITKWWSDKISVRVSDKTNPLAGSWAPTTTTTGTGLGVVAGGLGGGPTTTVASTSRSPITYEPFYEPSTFRVKDTKLPSDAIMESMKGELLNGLMSKVSDEELVKTFSKHFGMLIKQLQDDYQIKR